MHTSSSGKKVDRYFVINRYRSKGGKPKATIWECPSHAEAEALACDYKLQLLDLAGELHESFEVYVGSKTQLDRKLAAEGVR